MYFRGRGNKSLLFLTGLTCGIFNFVSYSTTSVERKGKAFSGLVRGEIAAMEGVLIIDNRQGKASLGPTKISSLKDLI